MHNGAGVPQTAATDGFSVCILLLKNKVSMKLSWNVR